MTPADAPSQEPPPPPLQRRSRGGLVDALMCVAAGVPVLGVVTGIAELFLLGTFALPVVVMFVCSLDPWTDDEIARLSGPARPGLTHPEPSRPPRDRE